MFEFKVIVMPTHQQRPILIFALYIYILIRIYNQVEKVKGENQGISKF